MIKFKHLLACLGILIFLSSPSVLGEDSVWCYPEYYRIGPVEGKVAELGFKPLPAAFNRKNDVYDAAEKKVSLVGQKGETVPFQIMVQGAHKNVTLESQGLPNVAFSYEGYLHTSNGANINWDIQFVPNSMEIPGKAKTMIACSIDLRKQTGTQSVTMEAILNQGRVSTFRKTLSLGSTLQYDTGLKYDSGLKYPGGTDRRQRIFINRNAELAALRVFGSDAFELVSHSWEFAVEE